MDEYQQQQQERDLLEAEVKRDFPGFVDRIKDGGKAVFVGYKSILCRTLTPECIRRIGALVVLCSYYGATVIFASDIAREVRAD